MTRRKTDGRDSEHRRVVITGIGPITASGIGVDAFWAGLHRGESPIRLVDRFDASLFRSQLAAQIDDFNPLNHLESQEARRLDRFGQFTLRLADCRIERSNFISLRLKELGC